MTNMDYNELLLKVDQAGFAVDEAQLYLDTHPMDQSALSYFNQAVDLYRNAVASYEAQFGPLMAVDNAGNANWAWGEDPWPWEGGCK